MKIEESIFCKVWLNPQKEALFRNSFVKDRFFWCGNREFSSKTWDKIENTASISENLKRIVTEIVRWDLKAKNKLEAKEA